MEVGLGPWGAGAEEWLEVGAEGFGPDVVALHVMTRRPHFIGICGADLAQPGQAVHQQRLLDAGGHGGAECVEVLNEGDQIRLALRLRPSVETPHQIDDERYLCADHPRPGTNRDIRLNDRIYRLR